MKFFIFYCMSLIAFCFALLDRNQKTTNNQDTIAGDQSYGGVHLFEFHGQHGGMGLGFKLIFTAVLIFAVVYWCLKDRICRSCQTFQTGLNVVNAAERGLPIIYNAQAPNQANTNANADSPHASSSRSGGLFQ